MKSRVAKLCLKASNGFAKLASRLTDEPRGLDEWEAAEANGDPVVLPTVTLTEEAKAMRVDPATRPQARVEESKSPSKPLEGSIEERLVRRW